MKTPAIGSQLLYFPSEDEGQGQPWVAFVTYVHSDGRFNIAGFESYGSRFVRTNVALQGNNPPPAGASFVSWPFEETLPAQPPGGDDNPPAFDLDGIGPLDEWGSHLIAGSGWPDLRYFTEAGWDRAITDQQRANISVQLSLDPVTGARGGFGPGPGNPTDDNPVGWGAIALQVPGGPDGVGGQKWVVDEVDNKKRRFERVRIRSRDPAELRRLAAEQKKP